MRTNIDAFLSDLQTDGSNLPSTYFYGREDKILVMKLAEIKPDQEAPLITGIQGPININYVISTLSEAADSQIKCFTRVIGLSTNIKTYHMQDISELTHNNAQLMSNAIKSNATINTVILQNIAISDRNIADTFFNFIEDKKSIKKLILKETISEIALQALFRAISKNASITEISMEKVKIGSDAFKNVLVAEEAGDNNSLQSLTMYECDIDNNSCNDLIKILSSCKILKSPDLTMNNIREDGAAALIEFLKQPNNKINKLNLTANPIGSQGIKHLATFLKDNPLKLKELHLDATDQAFETSDSQLASWNELAQAIRPNLHIKKLEVNANIEDIISSATTTIDGYIRRNNTPSSSARNRHRFQTRTVTNNSNDNSENNSNRNQPG
jgi:Ran GTPase-activating protein (RanGAP) involved in mRNA processing and transport